MRGKKASQRLLLKGETDQVAAGIRRRSRPPSTQESSAIPRGAFLSTWVRRCAALWASFRALGHSRPGAVLIMGYYVGTLANALLLPGGIGGVEGGMIGAFLAFGVNPSLTVLAVLAYRTISYGLPTVPGAIAYLRLRRTVAGWRSETTDTPGVTSARADNQSGCQYDTDECQFRRCESRVARRSVAGHSGSKLFNGSACRSAARTVGGLPVGACPASYGVAV